MNICCLNQFSYTLLTLHFLLLHSFLYRSFEEVWTPPRSVSLLPPPRKAILLRAGMAASSNVSDVTSATLVSSSGGWKGTDTKDKFIWACSNNRLNKSNTKLLKHALELNTCSFVNVSCNKGCNEDFCKVVLHPLSSKLMNSSITYLDQTLVILVCDGSIQFKNLTSSTLDPNKIRHVLLIERGEGFQAYRARALDNAPHGTLLTVDLPLFLSQLHRYSTKPVPVTFVSRDVGFYERSSPFLMVANGLDNNSIDGTRVREKAIAMFKSGFGSFFSTQDQGRGNVVGKDIVTYNDMSTVSTSSSTLSSTVVSDVSTSSSKKERILPTCTTGYSNMDSREYKGSRLTTLGHIRPFIRDGDLSTKVKAASLEFSKEILTSEFCATVFDTSHLNENQRTIKADLARDYYLASGGKLSTDSSWFKHCGEANLPVYQLAFHCDTQNCQAEGLDDVLVVSVGIPTDVLSVNCSELDKVKPTSKSKTNYINLKTHVLQKGYATEFPYTRVFYSKSMTYNVTIKVDRLRELAKTNKLNDILVWGLLDTLNTPLDYRGYVFDRDDFPKFFEDNCSRAEEDGTILQGKYLPLTAALDKIGYNSILLEVWNFLVTTFLLDVTIVNAIHYCFFCAWTCNGTVIPWRISCEIAKNMPSSRKLFKSLDDNLFLFLVKMDETIAELQAEELEAGEPRQTGSCKPCRSQYSRQAMSTDWSARAEEVLNCVNIAFFGSDIGGMKKEFTKKVKTLSGHSLLSNYIIDKFDGIGPFLVHSFISLLSLLGVCPLRTYEEAAISKSWTCKSGVVKLVAACIPPKDRKGTTPEDHINGFKSSCDSIMKNHACTKNFLENQTCETWRTYLGKLRTTGTNVKTLKTHDISIVKNNGNQGCSDKDDLYYWMPWKNGIQNLFLYSGLSKGFTFGSPGLIMKSPNHWAPVPMVYTDYNGQYTKTKKLPNLVYWDKTDIKSPITLDTSLVVTQELRDLYLTKCNKRSVKRTQF